MRSDPSWSITLNRYLYALGDPISQVDPYGLFCLTGRTTRASAGGSRTWRSG